MAPPSRTVPHPGRALVLLVVLIVAMLLGIIGPKLFSPGQWDHRFKVGLGLDLSSGTQVTLQALTDKKKPPSADEMNAAVSVIQSRVNGTGNSGAEVQPQGNSLLVVTVPGKGSAQTIQLVSSTALLMFRQVLLFEPYGATSTTTPAVSPSASASASASASPSASGSAQASPSASSTSTAKTSAKIVPAATSSPSPSTSASATASGSASPSASASVSPSPSASSPASATTFGNASLVTDKGVMALFNKLVCKPGDSQKWKAQVGYDQPPPAYNNPDKQVVACGDNGGVWGKYILDKAKVQGKQVTSASAGLSTTSNQWQVNLTMNGSGAAAFGALTSHLYSTYYTASQSGDQNAAYLDQVAIALDGNIVSAPEIQGAIPGGNAQITGSFTQQQATQLQDELKFGALPLSFKTQTVTSVSAQVGRNQLDAGLVAAAVGLLLVVLYSFFYYRGLGLVSVSSLLIAGIITYLAVVLLSLYQSFTLSLAGIAGLIVAIGITADSFVVYFERLRDEVREGKQLRPAVESGWKRARRTILVSDTVSFLAALLLYYFAIGDVKGFAYTLGLTTLIDVLVVFSFTKPMVTLLAGTRFFGNGHPMSGLDPARLGARTPWRSTVRRNQVKRRPDATPRSTVSRNPGGS